MKSTKKRSKRDDFDAILCPDPTQIRGRSRGGGRRFRDDFGTILGRFWRLLDPTVLILLPQKRGFGMALKSRITIRNPEKGAQARRLEAIQEVRSCGAANFGEFCPVGRGQAEPVRSVFLARRCSGWHSLGQRHKLPQTTTTTTSSAARGG